MNNYQLAQLSTLLQSCHSSPRRIQRQILERCTDFRQHPTLRPASEWGDKNSVIASTPEEDNAVAYCSLKEVKIGARTYSSTTYVTAPDYSAKGVIHNIPSYDSPAGIERSLEQITPRVLQARRLGEAASVLIVFEGKSVPYYVNYRNTTYGCLLYRRKIEVCENCYKVGHRKDICPTPDDKRCSKCGTLALEESHECNKLQTKKLHHPLQDLASEGKAALRTGALPLNQHTQVKGPLAVAVREDVVRVRVAAVAVPAVGEDGSGRKLIKVTVTLPAARKTRNPPEAQQPLRCKLQTFRPESSGFEPARSVSCRGEYTTLLAYSHTSLHISRFQGTSQITRDGPSSEWTSPGVLKWTLGDGFQTVLNHGPSLARPHSYALSFLVDRVLPSSPLVAPCLK
ncbi:hypothetical protein ISCGN_021689 [Ixodes scapularis]